MNTSPKWMRITGLVCHLLVGALMLFACGMKAANKLPPEAIEDMAKFGIADRLQMIGIGGLISAILLMIPRTSFLGSLAVSSYFGGAILLHMARHESYTLVAVILLVTWAGAILRHPSAFLNRD